MQELDCTLQEALEWFEQVRSAPYVLVRVPEKHTNALLNHLPNFTRRCYIADEPLLKKAQVRAAKGAQSLDECQELLINLKLPNKGAVMAGDFGEILLFLYQAAALLPKQAIGPPKWRLKSNRKKPAEGSDVVHFVVPEWPKSSEHDELYCAEVKLKSTKRKWEPITVAIDGCKTDRVSRLSRTLEWLKERGIEDPALLGEVTEEHLDRFIHRTEHPPFKKNYRAVAVICSSLCSNELVTAPKLRSSIYELIVLEVPDLHTLYNAVFEKAKSCRVPPPAGTP